MIFSEPLPIHLCRLLGEQGHARLESTVASDLSEHASGLARAETGHARVVTLRKDVMSAFEPDPSLIKRMPLT